MSGGIVGADAYSRKISGAVPTEPAAPGINPRFAAMHAGRRNRPTEHADVYPYVVAVLDVRTRVIECADGIQWIVQRRSVLKDGTAVWQSKSFCRTKQALLRCVREWVPGEHPKIKALPDRFPEKVRRASVREMEAA
jgi:hypothetical protein